jgi:hypothetical protein
MQTSPPNILSWFREEVPFAGTIRVYLEQERRVA